MDRDRLAWSRCLYQRLTDIGWLVSKAETGVQVPKADRDRVARA